MAGVAGLEPATIGFGDRCSTNWNYTPVDEGHYAKTPLKGKALFYTIGSSEAFLVTYNESNYNMLVNHPINRPAVPVLTLTFSQPLNTPSTFSNDTN